MPRLPKKTSIKEDIKYILTPVNKFYKAMTGQTGRKLESWEIMERKMKARDKKLIK